MKEDVLKYIFDKNAAQRKKVEKAFNANPGMENELEKFLTRYEPFMKNNSVALNELADAYLLLINQMILSRIKFMRDGRYPVSSPEEAEKNIYSDEKAMTKYMLGLALSQFLWAHHYKIFKFYQDIISASGSRKRILEVGSGHGLFTIELLDKIGHFDFMDIVDISETSLRITKSVIQTLKPSNRENINFLKHDICRFPAKSSYDFVTMGEVLEHVQNPLDVLKRIFSLLDKDGTAFISTCANSPAIDHFYHFKSVQHIREIAQDAGFEITKELVIPAEDRPESEIIRLKLDILYAAELKKPSR